MNIELKHDLIKIIVDKLLIAIIVIFFGLWANKLLESYKVDQSIKKELVIIRANKIAETWESAYATQNLLESAVKELGSVDSQVIKAEEELGNSYGAGYSKEKTLAKIKIIHERREKILAPLDIEKENLDKLIIKNRFWLGERQYSRLMEYRKKFDQLQFFSDKGEETSQEYFAKELENTRFFIQQAVDEITNE